MITVPGTIFSMEEQKKTNLPANMLKSIVIMDIAISQSDE